MSGTELSTALRYGLSPIVVVLNNGGYGTFRPMVDGPFNDGQPWQYAKIPRLIGGGRGYTVATEDELGPQRTSWPRLLPGPGKTTPPPPSSMCACPGTTARRG